jgi:hypothetical protein
MKLIISFLIHYLTAANKIMSFLVTFIGFKHGQ